MPNGTHPPPNIDPTNPVSMGMGMQWLIDSQGETHQGLQELKQQLKAGGMWMENATKQLNKLDNLPVRVEVLEGEREERLERQQFKKGRKSVWQDVRLWLLAAAVFGAGTLAFLKDLVELLARVLS